LTSDDELTIDDGRVTGEILATSTESFSEEETPLPTASEAAIAEEGIAVLPIRLLDPIDPDTYVPGELIVAFKNEVEERDIEAIEDVVNTDSVEMLSAERVVVETEGSIETAIAELEALPAVAYAEPNYVRSLDAFDTTSDPFADDLWGLEKIQASSAWASSTGEEVIVAVLDTAIDYEHEDLTENMWDGSACVASTSEPIPGGCMHGYDFVSNDANPGTSGVSPNGHGTHVAGTIAAQMGNQIGVAGIAPNAKIMALRIMDESGNGSVSDETEAIYFAIANGASVINASYTGSGDSQAEKDAIEAFEASGGLFIAAAGNQGHDIDQAGNAAYPASHDVDAIVSVAATNESDGLPSFSNFGEESVDLGAPGTGIVSTFPNDSYALASGTSMATPHVTGVAALLKSFRPNLGMDDVKEILLDSGDAIGALSGKTASGKRLNAYAALLAAESQTADTAPPVITLLGDNPTNNQFGQDYQEFGATALDETDGNLTSEIVITGSVDVNVSGTYVLTYTVSDSSGNVASETRDVIVGEPQESRRGGGGGGGGKKKDNPVRTIQAGTVLGATSAYVFTQNLSLGSSGVDVNELQSTLKNFGYFFGTASGSYDADTANAVSAYQRSRNLPETGVFDDATRASLNQLSALLAYLYSELARLIALKAAS
jgi:subtilisin family serine protease